MRYCFAVLAVLLLACGSCRITEARPLDDVKAAGSLRLAVYEDYFPFSYKEGGTANGIDVAIARRLAEMLGVRLELVFVTPGETQEADLRLNLWRGDLAGSPLSDVLLHVPYDKAFAAQNDMVFLVAPYFEEELALAYDPGVLPLIHEIRDIAGQPVAAEVATAGDFLLLMADGGLHRQHVRHYRSFAEAMAGFLRKETPVLIGCRSEIEGALYRAGPPAAAIRVTTLPETGFVRQHWPVGLAVKANARDLAYELARALEELRDGGELKRIFAAYGVSYRTVAGY